jgi:tetratricopeptide (TPR) repeat protein
VLHTLFQLVGIHYSGGDFSKVESAARSILATVPNDMASLQFLGLAYFRTGRKAEAMQILDAAPPEQDCTPPLEAAPGGDFLSRNGYSAAAACQLEATQRNPDLALAWYDLGVILSDLGRTELALRAFRSALAACPSYPSAMQALGPFTAQGEAGTRTAERTSAAAEDDE